MAIKYVSTDTTVLYKAATGKSKVVELLWGDRLELLEIDQAAPRSKVKARGGKVGYVNASDIGDESLLEIYFIDVGQGDGVLIKSPDFRHIMIDGGYKRKSQPSGKNAADFVDWKFSKDYGQDQIHLDAILASHNDADHYGGLSDLLDVAQSAELDAQSIRVDAFYHAGISWWINPETGERWLGKKSEDKQYITQILGNRQAVVSALTPGTIPELQGEWATFLKRVSQARTIDGSETPIHRLSQTTDFLPGFTGKNGGLAIRVLAPLETEVNGEPALRSYSSADSKNTNGNSILLRLDYGHARIILTGDLNKDSQRALLEAYGNNTEEFRCDVAKACHHGSDDVSYAFLNTMTPAVTVLSSGDNEGHDHPRPNIVAASATTGYIEIADDKLVSPLIYSTELARSNNLGRPTKLTVHGNNESTLDRDQLHQAELEVAVTKAGDLNPQTVKVRLDQAYVLADLIYGLVNVRTDGKKILCATLNERDSSWEIKKINARF